MPRVKRPDIKALRTARLEIALVEGQVFMETEKAYEIWEPPVPGGPLQRIKRIPKECVLWEISDESVAWHRETGLSIAVADEKLPTGSFAERR